MLDTIIVGVIILIAAVYAVRKIFFNKSGGCAGCKACSKGVEIKSHCTDADRQNR